MIADHILAPANLDDTSGRISHALGGVDGVSHSNSSEGLATALAAGYRIIEVDLAVTADGHVVCYHELDAPELPLPRPWPHVTRAEFLAGRYAGDLTPVDLEHVLCHLHEHDDVYLVTDTKNCNARILPQLMGQIARFGAGTARRIVPQTYRLSDLGDVLDLGFFEAVAFTRYLSDYGDDLIHWIARCPQVCMIAMYPELLTAEIQAMLRRHDCGAYVHTLNDETQIRDFHARGVGVFTDFCPPAQST